MEHIIGRTAAYWAKSRNLATPAEFVARCDDPQMLLDVLSKMSADGTIDAAALRQAQDVVGVGYDKRIPSVRTTDDDASNRLEKMLHDSRERYAKHVTAERCNLIRAAVPMLAETIASASTIGFVMARARRIATALYDESAFSATAEDSTVTLRLDAGGTTTVYHGQTDADAWAECLEYLTGAAERRAQHDRYESERLAKKAAKITAAVVGADSR